MLMSRFNKIWKSFFLLYVAVLLWYVVDISLLIKRILPHSTSQVPSRQYLYAKRIKSPHSISSVQKTQNIHAKGPGHKSTDLHLRGEQSNYFICPGFRSGLGNNIFQFASTYGIAYSKHMTLLIQQNDRVNSVFELRNNSVLSITKTRQACEGAIKRKEKLLCSYEPNLTKFPPGNNYYFGKNNLQSWKYFQGAESEIRKQLKFKKPIMLKVNSLIKHILKTHGLNSRENVTLIAIHVRRGDFLTKWWLEFGTTVATKEYFAKAMEIFYTYSNPVFIVCSDDLKWSRKYIRNKGNVEFMTGNKAEVDLALMSNCDHVIMSVGTFGWWAGWLSGGKVVYYKWPAKEGSAFRWHFSKDFMDYYYPHWIGI